MEKVRHPHNERTFVTGCIYYLKAPGRFGWMAMDETGRNDTSHVIWTLGTCFFSSFFL